MKVEKISTGSFDLNKWLHGGYEKGIITMIAGPPASGKTNFVLLASCSQAKKGNRVIFVDTEGGFSPERVEQIVGEEKSEEILKNILILNPTNFEEQKKVFVNLNLITPSSDLHFPLTLIVITLIINESSQQLNSLDNHILHHAHPYQRHTEHKKSLLPSSHVLE